jgi:1,4-alpha-glucan branching enzyme
VKKLLLFCLTFTLGTTAFGQIVKLNPAVVSAKDSVEIIFDATQGTRGLVGASSVYIHTGIILSSSNGTDWQNVVGNWGQDDGIGKMTKVANETDKWSFKLKPSIRDYYKVAANTTVFRLSMVFRNPAGTLEGKGTAGNFPGGSVAVNGDIFMDLDVGNFVQITKPTAFRNFILEDESLTIAATTSSVADSIVLFIDEGNGFKRVAAKTKTTELSHFYFSDKNVSFSTKSVAHFGSQRVEQTKAFEYVVRFNPLTSKLPANLKKGINYHDDNTKVTLVLLAPKKEFVYVVGDFSDWKIEEKLLMNKTPDGELYWLEINNLTPKKEYVFQYWVNGEIKIGDPYADKVADPWNDKFIPQSVYPNLPEYTKTEYEIASVLETDQIPFSWNTTEDSRPKYDKNELIIYELLVRDFIGSHSYKDLSDTLSYLKRLGVNAIELMPIMEFEGNESWGYNPSYFFAPDKYYGTKNDLKNFIQTAHQQGFVVLLDMVLNHAFGQNPLVKMYFKNGKITAENPWFNVDATHPFNVGYDFNHESKYTQAFVDSVNNYWLKEYHFDGYRFDLSKGFTQRNNPTNVGAWSARDDSRIALLKRMASKIRETSKDAYIILEHFADDSEENELKADGMMVWGNSTHDYGDLLTGKTSANIDAAKQLNRVSYMESHDEERLMVKALNSTAKSTTYAGANELTALNRVKLLTAFFYPLPGAKMMWQFQELGYDQSIDFNGRVGKKPLVWGEGSLRLYENGERQKLYTTHAKIINLVKDNAATFSTDNVTTNFNGAVKTIKADGSELDAVIIGNFSLDKNSGGLEFTHTGTWYDLFANDSLTVSNLSQTFELAPGEFKFFTDKKQAETQANLITTFESIVLSNPTNFNASTNVTLTFRAKYANSLKTDGLIGISDVYVVPGVVTNNPNDTTLTKKVSEVSAKTKLTKVTGKEDEWEIKLNPRTYFGATEADNIYRIGMYFQNADGSRIGKDYDGGNIFLNLQPDGKIVKISPAEFQPETEITVTFDAAVADPNGTTGLIGADKVYMHSGVITDGESSTSWQYVKGNWGQDDRIGLMSKVAGSTSKYQLKITPKTYYNAVPANATWNRIGMVFRNADGTKEGKAQGGTDIFVNFTPKTVAPETPLAAEDIITETTIVYPNPSADEVKILSDKPLESAIIYTLSGNKLGYLELVHEGINTYLIDISRIRNGNYLLVLKHNKGLVTKRLLIER